MSVEKNPPDALGLIGLTQTSSSFSPIGNGSPTLTQDETAIVAAINAQKAYLVNAGLTGVSYVTTLANLPLAGAAPQSVVVTGGALVAGDMGGGQFVWLPGGALPLKPGVVVARPTGQWLRIWNAVSVDASWLGDTDGQATINAAAGITASFPAGTYQTAGLVVTGTNSLQIKGAGGSPFSTDQRALMRPSAGFGQATSLITVSDAAAHPAPNLVKIGNIAFDGSKVATPGVQTAPHAITVLQAQNLTIRDASFENFLSHCVLIDGSAASSPAGARVMLVNMENLVAGYSSDYAFSVDLPALVVGAFTCFNFRNVDSDSCGGGLRLRSLADYFTFCVDGCAFQACQTEHNIEVAHTIGFIVNTYLEAAGPGKDVLNVSDDGIAIVFASNVSGAKPETGGTIIALGTQVNARLHNASYMRLGKQTDAPEFGQPNRYGGGFVPEVGYLCVDGQRVPWECTRRLGPNIHSDDSLFIARQGTVVIPFAVGGNGLTALPFGNGAVIWYPNERFIYETVDWQCDTTVTSSDPVPANTYFDVHLRNGVAQTILEYTQQYLVNGTLVAGARSRSKLNTQGVALLTGTGQIDALGYSIWDAGHGGTIDVSTLVMSGSGFANMLTGAGRFIIKGWYVDYPGV